MYCIILFLFLIVFSTLSNVSPTEDISYEENISHNDASYEEQPEEDICSEEFESSPPIIASASKIERGKKATSSSL